MIVQGPRLHGFQIAASRIRPRQYQDPQLHVDLHGLREHIPPFEPIAALVQNYQVKPLTPKALHSPGEGRTSSHLAPQFLKNFPVVSEILWVFVHQKDSGPVSWQQLACQPWAGSY